MLHVHDLGRGWGADHHLLHCSTSLAVSFRDCLCDLLHAADDKPCVKAAVAIMTGWFGTGLATLLARQPGDERG